MIRQNRLLSIGDISKLTGASIKALRYYDRIKLLQPAYIDPTSKYRYYTFDQIYLINIIMVCVELDIPLKELTKFIDENKIFDGAALLSYGKGIAEKKLKKLQQGLRLIDYAGQQIALSSKYPNGEIYSRKIPEKVFYVVPLENSFEDVDWADMWKLFLNLGYTEDDYEDSAESGILCEYSPSGIKRYAFVEVPKDTPRGDVKIIPKGTHFCVQNKTSQIENAPQIFGKQLKSTEYYLAIEIEIFAEKYEINKPINELRVILY